jgi:hypothetical protein
MFAYFLSMMAYEMHCAPVNALFVDAVAGVDAPSCGAASSACSSVNGSLYSVLFAGGSNVIIAIQSGVYNGTRNCLFQRATLPPTTAIAFVGSQRMPPVFTCTVAFSRLLTRNAVKQLTFSSMVFQSDGGSGSFQSPMTGRATISFDNVTFVRTSMSLFSMNATLSGVVFAGSFGAQSGPQIDVFDSELHARALSLHNISQQYGVRLTAGSVAMLDSVQFHGEPGVRISASALRLEKGASLFARSLSMDGLCASSLISAADASNLTASNVVIMNNLAVGDGLIIVDDASSVWFEGVILVNNTARDTAGVFDVINGTVVCRGALISDNSLANVTGRSLLTAGVARVVHGRVDFVDSTLRRNTAPGADASTATCDDKGVLTFTNTSVAAVQGVDTLDCRPQCVLRVDVLSKIAGSLGHYCVPMMKRGKNGK